MKADKYAKDIFKKLSYNFNSSNSDRINNSNNNYDDDYYIRIRDIPPRFQLYRKAKLDDVDHTVTIDELNFGLKRELAMTPEQRYLRKKANFLYHLKDCHFGSAVSDCKPECRLYHETGRIEDSEVIEEHDRLVDRLKQENRVIDSPSEEELLRLSKLIDFTP